MALPLRKCKTCGKDFQPERSTAKYCTDACRYHNHLATKKRVTIPSDMRFSILHRDQFTCRYCGARPPKTELRVDHIQSIEEGGARTDFNNLVTTCNPCNAGKSKRSLKPEEIPPLD